MTRTKDVLPLSYERDYYRTGFVVGVLLVAVLLNVLALVTASWAINHNLIEGVDSYEVTEVRTGAFEMCWTSTGFDDSSPHVETCYSFHSASPIASGTNSSRSMSLCDFRQTTFEALGIEETAPLLRLVESMCGTAGTAVIVLQFLSIASVLATIAVFLASAKVSFDRYQQFKFGVFVSLAVTVVLYCVLMLVWSVGIDHGGGSGVSVTLMIFSLLVLALAGYNVPLCVETSTPPTPSDAITRQDKDTAVAAV